MDHAANRSEIISHKERVRPVAICVCRHAGSILVAEYFDRRKMQTFYRPLGGTIEFGERGEEAARRELIEELGASLETIHFLGVLENIYVYEGRRGHEIVLVYDGELSDPLIYDQPELVGNEFGKPFKVVWKRLEEFSSGDPPLYPDGLLDLLGKTG